MVSVVVYVVFVVCLLMIEVVCCSGVYFVFVGRCVARVVIALCVVVLCVLLFVVCCLLFVVVYLFGVVCCLLFGGSWCLLCVARCVLFDVCVMCC